MDDFREGNWLLRADAAAGLRALHQAGQRVQMIYIDPPYNTGNTFAYHDRRAKDEWLAMMHPLLATAREILTPDGLIFISIDFNQLCELKLEMDRTFGTENLIGNFVWVSNLKGRQLGAGPAGTHEYILTYARDAAQVGKLRGRTELLQKLMPAVYHLPQRQVKHDARGEYVTKNELYNTNSKFNEVTAPSMVFDILYHPQTGAVRTSEVGAADPELAAAGWICAPPHPNAKPGLKYHAWRWSRAKVERDYADLEFQVRGRGEHRHLKIYTKIRNFHETALKDLVIGPSTISGQRELQRLGLGGLFETPKPTKLLQVLIEAGTSPGDTVLDFFAGSGTTGQAAHTTGRRFVLIQLEETFSSAKSTSASEHGLDTIADLTAARLRAAHVPFRETTL
ncbi:site-specific DNA-methyltransferase [Mobiluncus curtisii]|uniref:Site-specific DNA-methyltransferase n=2 Tax=Mobiluncus curtisii TaxID=2051 RepID=A0A7Y0UH76_9ACTO|nr:site-specific DNA-methyltransferase [Mobiluncus curtisii]NMW87097.1 site-specific DNA-methyltransferase [Mobiluncus curtisii]